VKGRFIVAESETKEKKAEERAEREAAKQQAAAQAAVPDQSLSASAIYDAQERAQQALFHQVKDDKKRE
jgi:IS5 family transposase